MTTYQIYGRKTYADPLTLIDKLALEQDAKVNDALLNQYNSAEWIELVAIPESKIIWARNGEVKSE